MNKFLVAAAGAAVMAVALSSGAQAQCWWTGLGSACAAPPPAAVYQPYYYTVPGYYADSPYWNYGQPNVNWNGGASSYPGPRASGHNH